MPQSWFSKALQRLVGRSQDARTATQESAPPPRTRPQAPAAGFRDEIRAAQAQWQREDQERRHEARIQAEQALADERRKQREEAEFTRAWQDTADHLHRLCGTEQLLHDANEQGFEGKCAVTRYRGPATYRYVQQGFPPRDSQLYGTTESTTNSATPLSIDYLADGYFLRHTRYILGTEREVSIFLGFVFKRPDSPRAGNTRPYEAQYGYCDGGLEDLNPPYTHDYNYFRWHFRHDLPANGNYASVRGAMVRCFKDALLHYIENYHQYLSNSRLT